MDHHGAPQWSGTAAELSHIMGLRQRDQRYCSICKDFRAFIVGLNLDGMGLPNANNPGKTQVEKTPVNNDRRIQQAEIAKIDDFGFIVPCPGEPSTQPGIHSVFINALEVCCSPGGEPVTLEFMNFVWNRRLPRIYQAMMIDKQMTEDFSKGSILKDRFVVGHSLDEDASHGCFNMGIILVRDTRGWGKYVLKLLPTKKSSPEVTREIDILRRLAHPNVTKLEDAQAPRNDYELPWMAVEHCALGTLHNFLLNANEIHARYRRLIPEALLWQVFGDLADAIRYCHFGDEDSNGEYREWDPIYHRDIILSNIFLARRHAHKNPYCLCRPVIKLGDFGCAVSEKELKCRGTRLTYLPEVCKSDWPPEGNVASVAGDVYQVGRVMFSLITHQDHEELWDSHDPLQDGERYPYHPRLSDNPRARQFHYPKKLKALINRCLHKYPEARPNSKDLVKLIEPASRDALQTPGSLYPWI
jgi:serine/threonine protein kinase